LRVHVRVRVPTERERARERERERERERDREREREMLLFIAAGPIAKVFAWGRGIVEDMCYEIRRAEACVDESDHPERERESVCVCE
jgi:hypothetical protein